MVGYSSCLYNSYKRFSRLFINNYLLPGVGACCVASVVFTMTYCCTVLCCCEEEYIYPLTIH